MIFFLGLIQILLLLWWYTQFPSLEKISSVYLYLFIFTIITWILALMDVKFGNVFPSNILLPQDITEFFKALILAFLAFFIPLAILSINYEILTPPMFASVSETLHLDAFSSFLIYGVIIAFTEEFFFGSALAPTLAESFASFSVGRFPSLILALLTNGVIFSIFHQATFQVTYLLPYFIFRVFIDILNFQLNTPLFGIFLHSLVNSYVISIAFNLPIQVAVVPAVVLVLIFSILTKRVRFL